MHIAVLIRQNDPFSLAIYREQIVRELSQQGIELTPFREEGPLPQHADIIWEPCLAGARKPAAIFRSTQKPLVATVHGAAPFSMPWRDIYPSFSRAVRGNIRKIETKMAWRWFRKRASAFIAVSQFGAREVARTFNLRRELISPIYHGVDHNVFKAEGNRYEQEKPYFLHVSRGAPKKNVQRIIEAYKTLPEHNRPELILVLPGSREPVDVQNITIVLVGKSPIELASLYRGACGFIFPSLHETFGMPILEAMACGCPVITANTSACAEVSGNAALLVNPYSVDKIARAMRCMMEDESLRRSLSNKGLERCQSFTWHNSAKAHINVFKKVLGEHNEA